MDSSPDSAGHPDESGTVGGPPVSDQGLVSGDGAEPGAGEVPGEGPSTRPALAKWLALYSLLRIGLLVVLAAGLSLLQMPLILAILFAIVLALPLSWVLFGGVRRRVNEAMAISTANRRAERDRLRSALHGQGPK